MLNPSGTSQTGTVRKLCFKKRSLITEFEAYYGRQYIHVASSYLQKYWLSTTSAIEDKTLYYRPDFGHLQNLKISQGILTYQL